MKGGIHVFFWANNGLISHISMKLKVKSTEKCLVTELALDTNTAKRCEHHITNITNNSTMELQH